MKSVAYLALAVVSCAFGYLALLSIGAPFLLTGVAMLMVFCSRSRPTVLWPTLAGIWASTASYVLVAPLECAWTAASSGVVATSCTNLLGIDYIGGANDNPPLLPALLAGIAAAIAVALSLRAILVRRAVAA